MQDVQSLPDLGDEPIVRCSSTADTMKCHSEDVPEISIGEDAPRESGQSVHTSAASDVDATPSWMRAVSRANSASRAARVAQLQSHVHRQRHFVDLVRRADTRTTTDTSPMDGGPSRRLLIFGSIGGQIAPASSLSRVP